MDTERDTLLHSNLTHLKETWEAAQSTDFFQ